jgi:serine/threonine protein kinase
MKKGTILKTAFEQYEVLEQVGQVGCGTVYKCKSEEKIFAVKLVNKNKGREKIKRFRNELNFCQKNNGKNVISVCDYGYYSENSEEYLFYAMPFYSQNLRNLMKNSISSERIIKIFFDICAGLSAAHKAGCVHRDLKPENILINNNVEAIIGDFGIAHFEDDCKVTTIETVATSKLANFAYHAPEQLNDGKVTPATVI